MDPHLTMATSSFGVKSSSSLSQGHWENNEEILLSTRVLLLDTCGKQNKVAHVGGEVLELCRPTVLPVHLQAPFLDDSPRGSVCSGRQVWGTLPAAWRALGSHKTLAERASE